MSPDGKRIVFVGPDDKIWVMNIDGSEQTQLTSWRGSCETSPVWTPDGKSIVFISDSSKDSHGNRNNDLWVRDFTSGQMTQLTTNGSDDQRPYFASS